MAKVVVGIHGLANKPPADQLAEWWEAAIREGLEVNCGIGDADFVFTMTYWAKYLYRQPLHSDADFKFDVLFNREPYRPAPEGALREHKEWMLDTVLAKGLSFFGHALDAAKEHFGMTRFADWVLGETLKDLSYYYDPEQKVRNRETPADPPVPARTALQGELERVLRSHRDDTVLLVSHSMGTIIAYDVLRDIGYGDRAFDISHFVSLGSPLGLPHVKAKIKEERAQRKSGADDPRPVRTPTIVSNSWANFADRRDPVALDVHLADDYGPNDRGVQVTDDLVHNDFEAPAPTPDDPDTREANAHKSYGYLRAPEFSRHLKAFLEG